MKVKYDFITNSSSTSFIINGKCGGFFRGCVSSLKDTVEDCLPEAKIDSILAVNTHYFRVNCPIIYYGDKGSMLITLKCLDHFFEEQHVDERPKPITYIEIDAESSVITTRKTHYVFNSVLYVLEQFAESMLRNNEKATFNYIQYPVLNGDGWNGGDPIGDYVYTDECYNGETKKILITILKNNGVVHFHLDVDQEDNKWLSQKRI